jgi:hypothetical protein
MERTDPDTSVDECLRRSNARNQIRRTVLRAKYETAKFLLASDGSTPSSGTDPIAIVRDATAPGRDTPFTAGSDAGLSGARFAQHGCSSPQGIAGTAEVAESADGNWGWNPGQHECAAVAGCAGWCMLICGMDTANAPDALPHNSEPSITAAMSLVFIVPADALSLTCTYAAVCDFSHIGQ